MRLERLKTYLDATLIHRDLEPDRLAQEASMLNNSYTATAPSERRLTDAMSIGALQGLRFSDAEA